MQLIDDHIRAIMPKAPPGWAAPLSAAMAQFGITEPLECSAFLAQIAHESAELNRLDENLNYTPQRLMSVWPKRFPTLAEASKYAGRPHDLANLIYGGRFGNSGPNDGWLFHGRGPIQITFHDNYLAFSKAVNKSDIVGCPDMLQTKQYGALSAAWFWTSHGLNKLADSGTLQDYDSIGRIVNGGVNGAAARRAYAEAAHKVYNVEWLA